MFGFPLPEFLMLVLGFGFLIFVHELGHFAAAKWVGIRAPRFAIGFGRSLFAWRKGIGFVIGSTEDEYERRCIEKLKADGVEPASAGPHTGTARYDTEEIKEKHNNNYTGKQIFTAGDELGLGETEYRLNWMPLGGYVKMLGQEDMDPNAKSDAPDAFNNKPIWARAIVISAGVVMNMIFGAIFLAIAFMIGVEFPSATVGTVQPGMPAATTYAEGHEDDPRYLGLQEGDVITSVNGKAPEDFKDIAIAVALGTSDSTVELVIERRGVVDGNGNPIPLIYKLKPERQKDGERLLSAGFQAGPGLDIASFEEAEGQAADWYRERLKVVPAEQRERGQAIRIKEVNGQAVESYADYLAAFDASGGMPVQVTLWDNAEPNASSVFPVDAAPKLMRSPDQPANLLGMVPAGKLQYVDEGSPAELAGMQVGDILVKVGPIDWPTDTLDIAELIGKDKTKAHKVVVMRDGKQMDLGEIKPSRKGKLGIVVVPDLDRLILADVLALSPGEAIGGAEGFIPGTRITHLNDKPIETWHQLQSGLQAYYSQPVEGERLPAELQIALPTAGAEPEWAVLTLDSKQEDALLAAGWGPDHSQYFPLTDYTLIKAAGLGDALMIGMDKTGDFVMQTYITLLRLIQGNVRLENLRGPVGIIDTGTAVAKQGVPYLLFFLGLISVNLAVINFLPIPIVDGGHIVFLIWEKITGNPPSETVQTWALYAGLAVIGFVFIATFYYDMMRLITRIF